MKKVIITIAALAFLSLPFYGNAQDEKKVTDEKTELVQKKEDKEKSEKKESQEIVIRNKGGKELNLKVEINGDKITVNGKPLDEFKDEQVTINNRKMIIRDDNNFMTYDFGPGFPKDFMGQWKGGKEESKAFLGVTTEKADEGAKVTEVIKGSAAEKAGLKKDDIITKVGDDKIEDGDNLSDVIGAKKPKEQVKVAYLRSGKENTVKATLGERKTSSRMTYTINGQPRAQVRAFTAPRPYITQDDNLDYENQAFGSLAPGVAYDAGPYLNSLSRQKKLGLKIQDTEEGGNVKVIAVEEGSAAEKAGLKKDDIITEIGGEKIENTDDAREQLMPSDEKTAYTVKAKRNGVEMSFEIKFPKKLKTANL